MSSKDKDNKSLQDKLKNYFKSRSNTGGNYPMPVNYTLTADLERDIGCSTPLYKRLKVIRDLGEKVLNNRLENPGVERIWKNTRDLLQRDQPRESRHIVLAFLRNLIQGQYEQLTIMRGVFFRFIREHEVAEDCQQRFELLQTLTENGKDIRCFEEEIGRFLLDWMARLECPSQIQEFLELIVNLVKYNAAYLDDDVVSDIVNNCCYLCCYCGVSEVVQTSLHVLETVVCYSIFPHPVLRTFVEALCRTANVEHYCQISWKIMRNMLGTDLGHAALYETVQVLNVGASDAGLTRGAVFYINMALWGAKRVTSLKATHTSVLPAFLKALEGEQSVVTYEVILALQSLISRHGSELHETAWEMMFSILSKIIARIEAQQSPNKLIESHLHDLITAVEQLHEQRLYNGNVAALYALVDSCGHARHEGSVMKLINWRASQLTPAHYDWLGQMSHLLERYCRIEKRATVRTHTLHVVHRLVQAHRRSYEEEILERVVLPHVQQSAQDADPEIRQLTAQLLVELASNCQSKACTELLDVMEKLLNRPFGGNVTSDCLPPDPKIVADIKTVLDGLIKIFHQKLRRLPSSHAVRTYLILLGHLERHYNRPSLFQHHPYIRMKILELFLSARASKHCHIGFCYDSADNALVGAAALRVKPLFSPYVCVEGGTLYSADGTVKVIGSHSPNTGGHQQNISFVSIRKACKLIIQCLTQERDWGVLMLVLREIPNVMQNKPLILSKQTNEIDMLASALCSMVMDKTPNAFESLRLPPGTKLTNSEFNGHVLPVLASLAPYHLNLDPNTQQKIVKCLIKFGLVLRQPQQCIAALTIYTLETRDTMVKLLPEVLLKLSQTSDTSQIAVPILEFLSTLTRLPSMFASFVADQYMSVFAILLPYTNPSRYNHYVVSLAHHVIAAWFLKCRLSYRRDFVKFIMHGLHNFILLPFEEAKFNRKNDFSLNVNEDSSNRMRSSSLGSRGREPMNRNALSGGAELGVRSAASASVAFHRELTETCVDLMARYTFSPCSVRPRRGPAADFMLSGGQSSTWVVGHEVVTITTSGCQQNSLRHGLCDRCLALCKQHTESMPSPGFLGGNTDVAELRGDPHNNEIKRYTKYTLQHSRSVETSSSSLSMSDNSLQPPYISSGQTTRQNSSENRSGSSDIPQTLSPKTTSDGGDTQAQLSLKLENLAKQEERGGGSGVGCWARGTCVCWCSGWVEVHVRRPTGDVSWVMRMQNQMNFDSTLESPLNDIIGLLAPSIQGGTHYLAQANSILNMSSSRSSGLGDSRNDILSDTDPRSRSGSSSSQHKSTQYSPGAAAPSLPASGVGAVERGDLQKSSSDSVVAPGGTTIEKKPPHASTHCIVPGGTSQQPSRNMGTEPIDIPGSPQRQSSASTTTDDDENIIPTFIDQGKSRHPVRRSNSSPEMSSSWKLPFQNVRERVDTEEAEAQPAPPEPPACHDMILLPSIEPTGPLTHHHQKKTGKNKDMRVSCEAIPEEMFSSGGTPPSLPSSQHGAQHASQHAALHAAQHAAHPHLMTYNSDPGQHEGQTAPATQANITTVASDTALNTLANKPVSDVNRQTNLQKASSESVRSQSELKVMAKPPQSPAPVSPGRSARGSVQVQLGSTAPTQPKPNVTLKLQDKLGQDRDDLPPLSRSKRSNTISVMSPTRKRRDNPSPKSREGTRPGGGGGVTPAFVLLQLYHNMSVHAHTQPHTNTQQSGGSGGGAPKDWVERPLLVSSVSHERSVKNLDHIPPLETYRVGVLYVGPGQTDETQILRNEFGSLRYAEFLRDLGTLIALEDADKHGLYLNVEKGGKDGHFAYVWQDDIMQVHFHVATLMPNSPNDPTANEKRKHIGNDYVSIVYNDSGVDFNINTIKGQFNFCIVMIEPLDHGINRVTIKTKEGRIDSKFVLQTECKVISDQNVALLARQLALHCTLASLISRSLNDSKHIPYASNSLERLRVIKRLRSRLIQERTASQDASYTVAYASDINRRNMDDFTEYT